MTHGAANCDDVFVGHCNTNSTVMLCSYHTVPFSTWLSICFFSAWV